MLKAIQAVLKPDGLLYWGQYGGWDHAGVWPDDHYEPKRFFSFLSDDQIKEVAAEFFELLYFKQIPLQGDPDFHFQSIILRRRERESCESSTST